MGAEGGHGHRRHRRRGAERARSPGRRGGSRAARGRALVRAASPPLVPCPRTLVFRVTPQSLTRSLTPYGPRSAMAPPAPRDAANSNEAAPPQAPDAQAFDPTETFTLNLLLDASDA